MEQIILQSCCSPRRKSDQNLLFGGMASTLPGVVKTITPQLYPMYLISVNDLLEETKLRPHQHLLRDNKVVQHEAHQAPDVWPGAYANTKCASARFSAGTVHSAPSAAAWQRRA